MPARSAPPARGRTRPRLHPGFVAAVRSGRRRAGPVAVTALLAPVLAATGLVGSSTLAGAAPAPAAALPLTHRYGDARYMSGAHLSGPIVGLARTPDGRGYWVVDADGRVTPRGATVAYGSAPGPLDGPVVGMASSPTGRGYWLVTRDGAVIGFGDAGHFGSLQGREVPSPIVGIAAAARGYYLAAADGRVYPFGPSAGQRSHVAMATPVVGIAATADGKGYWLAGAYGGVVAYGDATNHGSLHATYGGHTRSVVAIAPLPTGTGYWLATSAGSVYAFGAAARLGSTAPDPAGRPTVGLLSDADGRGYWELSTVVPPAPPAPAAAVSGRTLGTFSVTCYTGGGTTASGAPTGLDDVAVDPSVIPLGSRITISGVGPRTALDTGGAIIGNRLDIWEPTTTQCVDWGRRNEQVWLQS
jgi:3D (Asp-Asp-Asp) domain-containing protein